MIRDWSRFIDDFMEHRRVSEPFRNFQREAVTLKVGKFYSGNPNARAQPLNVIRQTETVLRSYLSGGCPQCTITHPNVAKRAAAYALERAVNVVARKDMKLGAIHKRWIIDAFYAPFGIIQVGTQTGMFLDDDHAVEYGNVYAKNVSIHDYAWDTAATCIDEMQFEGDHFSIEFDRLKESGLLPAATLNRLQPVEKTGYNEMGDERTAELTDMGGNRRHRHRVYQMVELWKIRLPFEEKIAFFEADASLRMVGKEPIAVVDYKGPHCGPYIKLILDPVPDQIPGLPPVACIRDLHDSINPLYKKAARQAARQKTNILFQGANDEDAKRHKNAVDGEAIRCEQPQAIKEVSVGGPHAGNFAFIDDALRKADWMAGNVNVLGGAPTGNESGKQDQMQRQAASVPVKEMQDSVRTATGLLMEAIAWHVEREPSLQPEFEVQGPAGLSVTDYYTPDLRMPGERWEFDVDPYSYKQPTPEERVAEIDETFRIIMEAAGVAPQSGVVPNLEGYLKLRSRYRNFQDLNELVTFATDQAAMPNPQTQRTMPPDTTRTYERVSRSATPQVNPAIAAMQRPQPAGVV